MIIATPVAPKNIVELIKKECESEVEVVFSPSQSSFHSVEQYHQNFEIVGDNEVKRIMKERELHSNSIF